MCDRLGLSNPIREEDIHIARIVFMAPYGKTTIIYGTDMNRAGRLFFQEKFSGPDFRVNSVDISAEFREKAREHFAELWDDAEEAGRTLIVAFKTAIRISPGWHYWSHNL